MKEELVYRGSWIRTVDLKKFLNKFHKKRWVSKDALVTKDNLKMKKHQGGEFDPNVWSLKKGAWDHEHCEICNVHIYQENDKDSVNEGYTDGEIWICEKCLDKIKKLK